MRDIFSLCVPNGEEGKERDQDKERDMQKKAKSGRGKGREGNRRGTVPVERETGK